MLEYGKQELGSRTAVFGRGVHHLGEDDCLHIIIDSVDLDAFVQLKTLHDVLAVLVIKESVRILGPSDSFELDSG